MSGSRTTNFSESESTCVVCFKIVDAFSVGSCDHPVCFECSTRMRVLCNQVECPICRQELPSVIFTKEVESFSALKPKVEKLNLYDKKYGIYFSTGSLQRRYNHLLDHECFICRRNANNVPFKTFQQLKEHMRHAHDLFYCELCVSNLKIFTFERKCYTRAELATHRRKGDVDNTSHRGHPLCEFCETRFMDNDELFRHLRRDHLFCHFCDADGKHQYYNTYNDLRKHYLDEHYLCEEGDCKYERFTSVFRTDIDLKAHYAAVHSKNLSRAANRQARTLELEFTLAPRMRPDGNNSRGSRHYGSRNTERPRENDVPTSLETYFVEPGGPGGGTNENQLLTNPLAAENFPSLGGDASSTLHTVSNVTITSKINPLSEDNFPVLGGASGNNKQSAVTITRSAVRGQHGFQRNSANFPVLGDSSSSSTVRLSVNSNMKDHPSSAKTPNVAIRVNHRPNGDITTLISQSTSSSSNGHTISVRPKSTGEAFPALSNTKVSHQQPQWVQQKTKNQQEPKSSKVAPAPNLPPSSLNDFPTLSKDNKNNSNKIASSSVWVNLKNFNSNTTPKKNKLVAKTSSKTIELAPPSATETIETKSKNAKKKKAKTNITSGDDLANSINKLEINTNSETTDSIHIPNGLTKKRSELNVEVGEQDIIVGYVNDTSNNVHKPPPGFKLKPPPGLNNFQLSNNDLVFTNSSGKNYQIAAHQFCPPSNFKSRNQFLIEKLKVVLQQSADAIQQFKMYSDMFRIGDIQAEKYYEHCKSLMGNEFGSLFPELLVLLPNVQRQQDLYAVHKSNSGAKGLEVCATCQQVILSSDLRDHLSNHVLDNHFPVLNHAVDDANAWSKK